MAVYTFKQLQDLWILYGGPPEVANVAAAIAIGESGGRTDATANEPDGSVSRGLWQINSVHGADSSYDVATNVRAAIKLYKSKGTFTDWTVFNKGIYKQFLNGTTDTSGGATGVDLPFGIPNPLDALRDIADKIGTIIKAGEWFADVHNIIRIAQVISGIGMIFVGLVMLNQSLIVKVVEPVVKTVATVKGG